MIDAGVGQHVRLALGGHTDMPSIGLRGAPLAVEGRVQAITDGEFVVTGPMYTGVRMHLGRTAVLDGHGRARRSSSPSARTSRSTSACSRMQASTRARSAT